MGPFAIAAAGLTLAGGLFGAAGTRAQAKALERQTDYNARTEEVAGLSSFYTAENNATTLDRTARRQLFEASQTLKSVRSDIRRGSASALAEAAARGVMSDDLRLDAAIQNEKEVQRLSYVFGQQQAATTNSAALQRFYGEQELKASRNRAAMIRHEGMSAAKGLRRQAAVQAVSAVADSFFSLAMAPKTSPKKKAPASDTLDMSQGANYAVNYTPATRTSTFNA